MTIQGEDNEVLPIPGSGRARFTGSIALGSRFSSMILIAWSFNQQQPQNLRVITILVFRMNFHSNQEEDIAGSTYKCYSSQMSLES